MSDHSSQTLIPAVLAGLVAALLAIIVSISFAALVFSGDLEVFLSRGVGIVVVSTMAICAILALTSQLKGAISIVQDAGIVILAGAAQQIGQHANSSFVTIAVFVALSTLAAGLFFWVLGRYRLGNLIRFIPYPVIGAFLAAVGVLLLQGAFSLTAGYTLSAAQLNRLIEPEAITRWLPALVFGLVMFGASHFSRHYLVIPGVLLLGISGFFAVMLVSGATVDTVQADGWMLGPFSESTAWQPVFLEDFTTIQWDLIADAIWYIPAIALVSSIALLLNLSGLEIQTEDQMDINRELQTVGLANLGLGLTGGFIGFQTISITLLGWRMNGKHRLTGLVLSALILIVLILGFDLIAYFPRFILGGLLIFLGIAILTEWVYDGWFKMPPPEYAIMIAILVIVATVGYLEGVGLGILAAAILFAINYSRLGNIKHMLNGQTYQSKVVRASALRHHLHAAGESLIIYRLHGFIFFGSANNLLERILAHLAAHPQVRFVILDFQQIQAVDSTAILTFARLHQRLRQHGAMLIFCGVTPAVCDLFARSQFDLSPSDTFRRFDELDEAVEWWEDQTLPEAEIHLSVQAQLLLELQQHEQILAYMKRMDVAAGTYLARQDEPSCDLYWVESGRLRAQLESGDQRQRIRVAQAGTMLGEMALYAGTSRSAAIVADEPSVVYVLTPEALDQMEADHPLLAAQFHRVIARTLAERLADTTQSLEQYL